MPLAHANPFYSPGDVRLPHHLPKSACLRSFGSATLAGQAGLLQMGKGKKGAPAYLSSHTSSNRQPLKTKRFGFIRLAVIGWG